MVSLSVVTMAASTADHLVVLRDAKLAACWVGSLAVTLAESSVDSMVADSVVRSVAQMAAELVADLGLQSAE
jgi:hypothetical protein